MNNDTYAFIVRIWQESEEGEEEQAAWRGSIEQVGSDLRVYFFDLDGILRFIQEQTGIRTQRQFLRWRPFWASLKAWIRNEFS